MCEHTGADAKEVSAGLKSEPRIGPKAYLGPGGPFAGGTLARDVVTLTKLADANGEKISVIPAIKQSNDLHRGWAFRRLQSRLGDLRGKKIAVLGLTYTTNTDTLRRSAAVELCQKLLAAGAKVTAFDPAVKQLPAEFAKVRLASRNRRRALTARMPPSFAPSGRNFARRIGRKWFRRCASRIFVDANRFLEKELKNICRRRTSFRRTRLI